MPRPMTGLTMALVALLPAVPAHSSERVTEPRPIQVAASNSCRDNNPAMADFTALQCVPQAGSSAQREPGAGAAPPRANKPRKTKPKKG